MVHKKIKKTILVIILIILILLFITLNLSIFYHKMEFLKESILACENLKIGDECFVETFLLDEKGTCFLYKRDKLVCRVKKINGT